MVVVPVYPDKCVEVRVLERVGKMGEKVRILPLGKVCYSVWVLGKAVGNGVVRQCVA